MSERESLFPFGPTALPSGTNAWCHVVFDQWWTWLRRRGYVG